ncbi:hypothetical protein, partial [Streptococcus pneumoniae]|uniref:hypothetical protein n=1 Tax=Streptococcus pneumoniae TaxID=1313 RepID=UPI00345632C5
KYTPPVNICQMFYITFLLQISISKPKTADLLFLSSKNMTSNFIVFLDKSLATMQQLASLDIEDIADKLT